MSEPSSKTCSTERRVNSKASSMGDKPLRFSNSSTNRQSAPTSICTQGQSNQFDDRNASAKRDLFVTQWILSQESSIISSHAVTSLINTPEIAKNLKTIRSTLQQVFINNANEDQKEEHNRLLNQALDTFARIDSAAVASAEDTEARERQEELKTSSAVQKEQDQAAQRPIKYCTKSKQVPEENDKEPTSPKCSAKALVEPASSPQQQAEKDEPLVKKTEASDTKTSDSSKQGETESPQNQKLTPTTTKNEFKTSTTPKPKTAVEPRTNPSVDQQLEERRRRLAAQQSQASSQTVSNQKVKESQKKSVEDQPKQQINQSSIQHQKKTESETEDKIPSDYVPEVSVPANQDSNQVDSTSHERTVSDTAERDADSSHQISYGKSESSEPKSSNSETAKKSDKTSGETERKEEATKPNPIEVDFKFRTFGLARRSASVPRPRLKNFFNFENEGSRPAIGQGSKLLEKRAARPLTQDVPQLENVDDVQDTDVAQETTPPQFSSSKAQEVSLVTEASNSRSSHTQPQPQTKTTAQRFDEAVGQALDDSKQKNQDQLKTDSAHQQHQNPKVQDMINMGFDAKLAERALQKCHNNVELAVDYLVQLEKLKGSKTPRSSRSGDSTLKSSSRNLAEGKPSQHCPAAERVPEQSSSPSVHDTSFHHSNPNVMKLFELGFEVKRAERVLAICGNDVERAIQYMAPGGASKTLRSKEAKNPSLSAETSHLSQDSTRSLLQRTRDVVKSQNNESQGFSLSPPNHHSSKAESPQQSPLVESTPTSHPVNSDPKVQKLVEMGFDEKDAEAKLRWFRGDIDQAADWLARFSQFKHSRTTTNDRAKPFTTGHLSSRSSPSYQSNSSTSKSPNQRTEEDKNPSLSAQIRHVSPGSTNSHSQISGDVIKPHTVEPQRSSPSPPNHHSSKSESPQQSPLVESTPTSHPVHTDPKVQKLVEMGFDFKDVERELRLWKGDIDQAADCLARRSHNRSSRTTAAHHTEPLTTYTTGQRSSRLHSSFHPSNSVKYQSSVTKSPTRKSHRSSQLEPCRVLSNSYSPSPVSRSPSSSIDYPFNQRSGYSAHTNHHDIPGTSSTRGKTKDLFKGKPTRPAPSIPSASVSPRDYRNTSVPSYLRPTTASQQKTVDARSSDIYHKHSPSSNRFESVIKRHGRTVDSSRALSARADHHRTSSHKSRSASAFPGRSCIHPDEAKLTKLMGMGFEERQAEAALCRFSNNFDLALEHLLGNLSFT
ncbi:hypothetical protein P9112_014202 [Eukaryota sp. TZLM1-RC]